MIELWADAFVFVIQLVVVAAVGGALVAAVGGVLFIFFFPIFLGIKATIRKLNSIKNPANRVATWILFVIVLFALWPLALIWFWFVGVVVEVVAEPHR